MEKAGPSCNIAVLVLGSDEASTNPIDVIAHGSKNTKRMKPKLISESDKPTLKPVDMSAELSKGYEFVYQGVSRSNDDDVEDNVRGDGDREVDIHEQILEHERQKRQVLKKVFSPKLLQDMEHDRRMLAKSIREKPELKRLNARRVYPLRMKYPQFNL